METVEIKKDNIRTIGIAGSRVTEKGNEIIKVNTDIIESVTPKDPTMFTSEFVNKFSKAVYEKQNVQFLLEETYNRARELEDQLKELKDFIFTYSNLFDIKYKTFDKEVKFDYSQSGDVIQALRK